MEAFLLILIGLTISVVCSVWCARTALDKGYSPGLWGVLGFVLPVLAVIAIALVHPSDRAR